MKPLKMATKKNPVGREAVQVKESSVGGSMPVVVILTSYNCGSCKVMRGDGHILTPQEIVKQGGIKRINGMHHWDDVFFKKLLTGSFSPQSDEKISSRDPREEGTGPQRVRVYEVHTTFMNDPSIENMMDFSEFILTPEMAVKRITYNPYINRTGLRKTTITTTINRGNQVETQKEDSDQLWDTVLKQKIPVSLVNYYGIYPAFLFAEGSQWDSAISRKSSLYAYMDGVMTIEKAGIPGVWTLRLIREEVKPARDPVIVINDIVEGRLRLQPTTSMKVLEDGYTRVATIGCTNPGYKVQSYIPK